MGDNRFEERYQSGDTPWDHGLVDTNLIEIVSAQKIDPCHVLDVGCGTGENALWMARQGFDVVACDLSPTAIKQAQSKLPAAGAEVRFLTADFLKDPIPGAPYEFLFDRGCLHCMVEITERKTFVKKVASLLEPDGYWLSLIGNADEPEREVGPPKLTAAEVAIAVEPCFEILSMTAGHFGSDQEEPPRAWICLMKKRRG